MKLRLFGAACAISTAVAIPYSAQAASILACNATYRLSIRTDTSCAQPGITGHTDITGTAGL